MTVSDLLHLPAGVQLPSLASDPRVTVEWRDALEPDPCSECPDGLVLPGVLCVEYDQWSGTGYRTYACGPEHGNEALSWLLRKRPNPKDQPRNIRLLVVREKPLPALPVPEPGGDMEFELYHALVKWVETLPNTASDDMTGPEGFRLARDHIRAHLAQLGINRIKQMEGEAA